MSSKVFFYCLKVWLTSVVLGPVIFWCWEIPDILTLSSFLAYLGIAILYGLVFSLLSFLLLWAGIAFLYRRGWPLTRQRLAAACWGLTLTLVPFLVLFARADSVMQPDSVHLSLSYLFPILVGIFVYQWPGRRPRTER
ncbi:MAG TPA: hypothetical protein VKQ52_02035 [Puia sp.]|nr:hypothetical protein [Puia sp.]